MDNTDRTFLEGFIARCAERGVAPAELIKTATGQQQIDEDLRTRRRARDNDFSIVHPDGERVPVHAMNDDLRARQAARDSVTPEQRATVKPLHQVVTAPTGGKGEWFPGFKAMFSRPKMPTREELGLSPEGTGRPPENPLIQSTPAPAKVYSIPEYSVAQVIDSKLNGRELSPGEAAAREWAIRRGGKAIEHRWLGNDTIKQNIGTAYEDINNVGDINAALDQHRGATNSADRAAAISTGTRAFRNLTAPRNGKGNAGSFANTGVSQ